MRFFQDPRFNQYVSVVPSLPVDAVIDSATKLNEIYQNSLIQRGMIEQQLGAMDVVPGDEQLKQQKIDQLNKSIDDFIAGGGDWDRADAFLVQAATNLAKDEDLRYMRQSAENFRKDQEIDFQLRARGITPVDLSQAINGPNFSSVYTDQQGNIQRRIYQTGVQERLNWDQYREQLFNQLTASGGTRVVTDPKTGERRVIHSKGISEADIRRYAPEAMKRYRESNAYLQEKSDLLNRGLAASDADADRIIMEKLVSSGMEKVFNDSSMQIIGGGRASGRGSVAQRPTSLFSGVPNRKMIQGSEWDPFSNDNLGVPIISSSTARATRVNQYTTGSGGYFKVQGGSNTWGKSANERRTDPLAWENATIAGKHIGFVVDDPNHADRKGELVVMGDTSWGSGVGVGENMDPNSNPVERELDEFGNPRYFIMTGEDRNDTQKVYLRPTMMTEIINEDGDEKILEVSDDLTDALTFFGPQYASLIYQPFPVRPGQPISQVDIQQGQELFSTYGADIVGELQQQAMLNPESREQIAGMIQGIARVGDKMNQPGQGVVFDQNDAAVLQWLNQQILDRMHGSIMSTLPKPADTYRVDASYYHGFTNPYTPTNE